MTSIICNIKDCKYRSKWPMRKYIKSNGKHCYKCTLEVINIKNESTIETDELFGKEFPCCSNYKKKEKLK